MMGEVKLHTPLIWKLSNEIHALRKNSLLTVVRNMGELVRTWQYRKCPSPYLESKSVSCSSYCMIMNGEEKVFTVSFKVLSNQITKMNDHVSTIHQPMCG
jgi:hypothetical protein